MDGLELTSCRHSACRHPLSLSLRLDIPRRRRWHQALGEGHGQEHGGVEHGPEGDAGGWLSRAEMMRGVGTEMGGRRS